MIGGRYFLAKAFGLIAIAALSASPSLPIENVLDQDLQGQMSADIREQLDLMSTGVDQEVLLAGSDAQSRNSRIPVVAGQTRLLAAYAPIKASSESYPVALKCLSQAVYYEAANESRQGKQAVAQVVLNRMRHPAYPDSVCAVVYQGVNDRVCQFSFTCDGALKRVPLARQWQESQSVAEDALAGKQFAAVGTATHYHADYVVPKWAYTLTKLQVIGRHIFYRFPGNAGNPRAFSSKWARSERMPAINWDRFANGDEGEATFEIAAEETWTPGLTVTPDKTDRHALSDVGGRLDTTKQWRLSIPDPVGASGAYQAALEAQSDADQSTSIQSSEAADTQ